MRRNAYTCQTCGKTIVTEDRDEGTTPFMLGCRATKGCSILPLIGNLLDMWDQVPNDVAEHDSLGNLAGAITQIRRAMEATYE